MKISQLIFLSFVFILLLFSFTTFINFRLSKKVDDNNAIVEQSANIIRNSSRFQRNIINMVSGLRGYLLTGENYFTESYDSAAIENKVILSELERQVPNDTYGGKLLLEIRALNNRWIEDFAMPLRQAKYESLLFPEKKVEFRQMYSDEFIASDEKEINTLLQSKFREFSNHQYDNRALSQQALTESIRETKTVSLVLTILSLIVGILIIYFLARIISRRIQTMVKLADSIAAGNFEARISDTKNDELTPLTTSLDNMARVLSNTISQLKKKNDELDQFAHIVSHDLKTPIRGIDNVLSWIDEDHAEEMSPKVKEYLDIIKERLNRSESLVNGILSYSRVGKENKVTEMVDTEALVREVWDTLSLRPGLKLFVQDAMPVMETERIPLLQVFSNLIGNAVKYHNKQDGWVRIYFKEYPGRYRFFVEDNGPGIDERYHKKIFIIFQTLKERDSEESTGVGLAIVKKILDVRNEQIVVESELQKGTIFSFTWSK